MPMSKLIATITAIVTGAALVVACGAGSDQGAPSASAPTTSTTDVVEPGDPPPPITAHTADVPTTLLEPSFPPPDLPLQTESELMVGEPNLVRLIGGDDWLFGVVPPSTVVRIDPNTGDIARLDLDLGESREGPIGHAFIDGTLWALGGSFRDTLVEVDPVSMTETRRIQLEDDHGIRSSPADELWLTTLRGVRPVDVESGEIGSLVPLEVDPADLSTSDGVVWVTLPAAAQIARIDTSENRVDLIDTEPGPRNIAVHDGIV